MKEFITIQCSNLQSLDSDAGSFIKKGATILEAFINEELEGEDSAFKYCQNFAVSLPGSFITEIASLEDKREIENWDKHSAKYRLREIVAQTNGWFRMDAMANVLAASFRWPVEKELLHFVGYTLNNRANGGKLHKQYRRPFNYYRRKN